MPGQWWESGDAWAERPTAAPAWEDRSSAANTWSERAQPAAAAEIAEDPWAQSAEDPWAQRADQQQRQPAAAAAASAFNAAASWGAVRTEQAPAAHWGTPADGRDSAPAAAASASNAAASWGAVRTEQAPAAHWGTPADAPGGGGMETSDAQKRARQRDFQAYQDWNKQSGILPGKSAEEVAEDERTLFQAKPFQGAGADFSLYDAVTCEVSGPKTDEMPYIYRCMYVLSMYVCCLLYCLCTFICMCILCMYVLCMSFIA